MKIASRYKSATVINKLTFFAVTLGCLKNLLTGNKNKDSLSLQTHFALIQIVCLLTVPVSQPTFIHVVTSSMKICKYKTLFDGFINIQTLEKSSSFISLLFIKESTCFCTFSAQNKVDCKVTH